MADSRRTPPTNPANLPLHTQETFYDAQDGACATRSWPAGEVEEAFARYRTAIDVSDHDTMAALLSEEGRGGNAIYGFFHGRAAYRKFLTECWLEVIPNVSVWHVIEGGRVVNKWRESLPGTTSEGARYDYFGISEIIYAGEGSFRFIYSIPDLFGLNLLYARWKADGQHQTHGDLYPGLGALAVR